MTATGRATGHVNKVGEAPDGNGGCGELLGAGRIRELGDVLTAPQSLQREDFEVSLPEVDPAVDTALRDGSPGSELIRGGLGVRVATLVGADGPPSSRAGRVPCPRTARPARAELQDRGRHRWRTPAPHEHREPAEATSS